MLLSHLISVESLKSTFVDVNDIAPCPVRLKLEGINIAGSIKLKTALQMITDLEDAGVLIPGKRIIESSSGNLGVAVALICAERGYSFTCVTDPNASSSAVSRMRAMGATVITVRQRDRTGNYLGTRIATIQEMCRSDPDVVWLNQYANPSNWRAHYRTTAPEILLASPRVDYLVIGAGTTGTLMGCARYFREYSPHTVIVGVDSHGSVTFGGAPRERFIPGIGASRRPEIADESLIDLLLFVDEADGIRMCRSMARKGLPVGGSTGSVLHGVRQLSYRLRPDSVVVAVSPDMADKYLDTVYSDEWVGDRFPEALRDRPAPLMPSFPIAHAKVGATNDSR
ncbi:MAG TPA: 2,3-diaminopropionate biosynthesis protein SbnA [Actinoplanes sp.]|nr:2,3-diaminopropionate biosynthesis protein SbnA [Actinoplanes sp.]